MAHRSWLDHAVFYEIYPQSFLDTDGDGIGDIEGVIQKLDYIQELGCNAIWLNPCFESPFGDAGYDVSDYCRIAPRYGTNEDAKRLFTEAHRRGMHVLLDLVPGHTSIEHPWFKASCQAERNAYTDRYIWTNSIWEWPDMPCIRGISDRDGACAVNFFSHQPALNYGYYKPEKPWQQSMDDEGPQATIQAMKDVMRFWLGMGCDGFRVDMADSLVKGDPDRKGTIKLWQGVRSFLEKEFPEAAMVSEWGNPEQSLLGGFHMDFLLHFGPSHYTDLFRCPEPFFSSRGKGDIKAFAEHYESYRRQAGTEGLICIPSGNHDMDRLARHLTPEEQRIAFAFLLTMPGVPFIYYGDEISMRYVEGLQSVEGGYSRTGSRSPMQWDRTTNAGFSSAAKERLYIPIDPSDDRPTVQTQMANPTSLWHEVKRLIELRHQHAALDNRGDFSFQHVGDPLVYRRQAEGESLLVIIHPAATKAYVDDVRGRILYSVGADAYMTNGSCVLDGPAAVLIDETN